MRLIVLLLLALAMGGCDRQKAGGQQGEAEVVAPVMGVDRSRAGTQAPDVIFLAPGGDEVAMTEFENVPVLVNLWATWCVPCVKELPTLDRLAAAHAANDKLEVVAVSQDKAPQGSIEAFFVKHGIRHLGLYHDPDMKLSGALGAQVLPTSILFDSQGREVWRYVGDQDWTSPEAAKLLAEAR